MAKPAPTPQPTPAVPKWAAFAVAAVFKKKAIDAAKDEIADGSTVHVDLWARVTGSITRENGKPGVEDGTAPADVKLTSEGFYLAVLKQLGIAEARTGRAMRAVAKRLKSPADVSELGAAVPHLVRVREEVEAETVKRLGPQPVNTDPTRGRVTTALNARLMPAFGKDPAALALAA